MTDNQKKDIQALVRAFVEQYPSQKHACSQLVNASESTVIQISSNRWNLISDEMWRNIGKQVGWNSRGAWYMDETQDFTTLVTFFSDAKDYGNVFAITGPAGSGKSFTAEWYAKHKSNVLWIECKEYWNRKVFLKKVVEKLGKDSSGMNVSELMDFIVECLLKMDRPLLILDEFDKLSDQLFFFFIALYNELKGKCGIVLMATDHLAKRIKRGKDTNKRGYSEIFSRIGRRFINLHGTDKKEIEAICKKNGIDNPIDINEIFNDCEGDLRRVERSVHKKKLRNNKAAA